MKRNTLATILSKPGNPKAELEKYPSDKGSPQERNQMDCGRWQGYLPMGDWWCGKNSLAESQCSLHLVTRPIFALYWVGFRQLSLMNKAWSSSQVYKIVPTSSNWMKSEELPSLSSLGSLILPPGLRATMVFSVWSLRLQLFFWTTSQLLEAKSAL